MKARVVVTELCGRNCQGCCNLSALPSAERIRSLYDLYSFKPTEIILTGGEPLLNQNTFENTLIHAQQAMMLESVKDIWLYTASYFFTLPKLLPFLSGVTFTVHDKDSEPALWHMTRCLKDYERRFGARLHNRVFFDSRIKKPILTPLDRLNGPWNVVKKFKWACDGVCPLPNDEKLFIIKD